MGKYPEEIYESVRQNLGLKKDDTSKDGEIDQMTKFEVFTRVVTWNNLPGWEYTLSSWIRDIYGIDIENIK